MGLAIESMDHPFRKVDVDALGLGAHASRLVQIQVICNFFACVELAANCGA